MQLNFGAYRITPIHPKDGWNICNFVVANENRIKRYFPETLAQNLTPNLSNIFVAKKIKQFKNKQEFLCTIKPLEAHTILGLIYIKAVNWTEKQGELAYAIDYTIKGKGIMGDAIKVLSDYAFDVLDLQTLQIIVHKTNIGSLKVAENNNFTWIKTLENEFTPPGENPLNMELYELYKEIE